MKFLDSDNNTIAFYDPEDYAGKIKQYEIAKNEEIIGVYGNKNNGKAFKNFGFIVKVK